MAVLVMTVDPYAGEPADYRDRIRSKAEEKIKEKNRFQVVDDPARADLVCMVVIYRPQWPHRGGPSSLADSIVILKGGANPHWDAAPVWMETLSSGRSEFYEYLLGRFHSQFEKAEKSRQNPTGNSQEQLAERSSGHAHSGKNLFVACWTGTNSKCASHKYESEIQAILDKGAGRWTVVPEPADADLVLVWFDAMDSAHGYHINIERKYAGVFVFKGGTHADWSKIPWLAKTGPDPVDLFRRVTDAL